MIEEKTRVPNRRDAEIAELMAAPSHVYFVYSAGLVKIGFSTDWLARVETVSRGCPHDAQTILVMPWSRTDEAGFHALFDEYRTVGEWFRCEGKVREFLMMYATKEGREQLELALEDDCEEAMQ